jgi:hypothetical protein
MTRRRILSIIANITGAVMDTDKAEALIAPMLSDHHPRCRVSDRRRQISFLRILRRGIRPAADTATRTGKLRRISECGSRKIAEARKQSSRWRGRHRQHAGRMCSPERIKRLDPPSLIPARQAERGGYNDLFWRKPPSKPPLKKRNQPAAAAEPM